DAPSAPCLQRYFFLDRMRPIGLIGQYPRLKAWADTLMKRPSTHSFPEAEFELLYRLNVKRRKKWLSQFVAEAAVAAADKASKFASGVRKALGSDFYISTFLLRADHRHRDPLASH